MTENIALSFGTVTLKAVLNESSAAKEIASRLPLEVEMSRWGDEYYGALDSALPSIGDNRDEMKIGELAYWPPGRALCVFFGPTPASEGSEPRAASPVVPLGQVVGDATQLRKLPASVAVRIERS